MKITTCKGQNQNKAHTEKYGCGIRRWENDTKSSPSIGLD